MMSYSDKLARPYDGKTRCQHMDLDGNRCRKDAKWECAVHPDSDYQPKARFSWYSVYLCGTHAADV